MGGAEKCQAFIAISQLKVGEPYQFKLSEDFKPFRRNINFMDCNEVSILTMISELQFIESKKSWGYPFRFGFFEINKADFELINKEMLRKDAG